MSVYLRFYTVLGKYEEYETKLKELVNRFKELLKEKGLDPDRVNLMLVKIKEDVAEQALRIAREGGSPPESIRNLIELLRSDYIQNIPALVINGKKIAEGTLPDLSKVEEALYEEVRNVLGVDLRVEVRPVEKPVEVVAETKPTRPVVIEEVERTETTPSIRVVRGFPDNCAECIYYGVNTKYCFLLGRRVEDPSRPLCRRESL